MSRWLITTRLAVAARARGIDPDSPELERFVENWLAENLLEGHDAYDRDAGGQQAFARLLRDLRRRLRLEGQG